MNIAEQATSMGFVPRVLILVSAFFIGSILLADTIPSWADEASKKPEFRQTEIMVPGEENSKKNMQVGGETNSATMIVTANKVDEDILYVPQAISIFDSKDIKDKGIREIQDIYDTQIPNMGQGGFYNNAVSFRGLTPSVFSNNNPIVLYVDGIPQTNSHGFNSSLRNIERVEVLRGAQGTIYGKDAIGGVINIITKEPDNAWSGNMGTEYGSRNYHYGYFDIDGPLRNDMIYMGVSLKGDKDDGWITNSFPGAEKNANAKKFWGINTYLLIVPTEKLRAKLHINNFYDRSEGEDGYAVYKGPLTSVSDLSRDDAENLRFDVPGLVKIGSEAQALKLEYDFDFASATSLTTHKIVEDNYQEDSDSTDLYANAGAARFRSQTMENWTQELRFTSPNKVGLRWIGGIYAESEKKDFSPVGMSFVHPANGNMAMLGYSELKDRTTAIFGQIIFPFANEFELTLGGRYQHLNQEMNIDMYMRPSGEPRNHAERPINSLESKMSSHAFLPKFAMSYNLDNWSLYTSITKGYMPGGYNYFGMSKDIESYKFDPAKTWDYEIGMKARYDRMYVAVNIFYMDMKDMHVSKTFPGGIYLADNAKKAHSYGSELDLKYTVTKNLSFTGSLGLIHSEYDDYDVGLKKFDGQHILYTPDYTLNLGVNYDHPCGLFANINFRNEGRRYLYNTINQRLERSNGHTLVNLKAGYHFAKWEIYGFANNLTNEEYVVKYQGRKNGVWGTFNEPRRLGIGVNYHF